MAKKMTQKDFFNEILANYDLTDAHKEFIEGRLEALAKKSSSGSKKPSVTQILNEQLKACILENMVKGKSYTITDMIKNFNELADFTNQKVSALVRQLIDEGKVERAMVKGVACFSLVD